ncbi:MAG: thiamine pyrophosphokinase [Herpetosiphonaceae bacterium]|nr:MAG: thiamine pyrophosphokinase [Herpetosiphonaceae bacterium]
MLTVIVADAPDTDISAFRPLVDCAQLRIAADGGARYLLALGVRPDLVIGDLDSLPEELLAALADQGTQIERHPAEKEETDLELALLRAVEQGASRMIVLAALGGRHDQHLANLLLLAHPQLQRREVMILDGSWEIRLISESVEITGRPGEIVSLLPLGTAHGVTTEGLYYPLRDESLLLGPARGVSNILLGERARIIVREGLLWLFHCRDSPAAAIELISPDR